MAGTHDTGGARRTVAIGIAEQHVELGRVVRSFLDRRGVRAAARASVEGEDWTGTFWKELGALGWLGLHLPEEHGGSGYGLVELAVVAEEMGRACAPGPFLPTVVTSGTLGTVGTGGPLRDLAAAMAAGDITVGLGTSGDLRLDESGRLHGDAGPVVGGDGVDLVAVAVAGDLVLVDPRCAGVLVTARANLDPSRRSAAVRFDGAQVREDHVVRGGMSVARRLLAVVAAAEAAGGAAACLEMATEYAASREAFGRPIGQFQAVKHHCANMLIAERLAVAAAWNAARRDVDQLVADAAVVVALPAFLQCAKLNIQVHGGIGFTWEHDAHLYLRRAAALVALAGPLDRARRALGEAGFDASGDAIGVDLPPEAEDHREQARRFVAAYRERPVEQRHQLAIDEGYLFPHWPRPWGRGADPVEQLVLEEELEGLRLMAPLGPTGWTLAINIPTLIAHGTEEQQERWIRPTLEGRLTWCQLLSEPGAGSDLAALATRATRVDGGWRVTGQKVWTSNAHQAKVGFALVRTDPAAPRHAGLTCMVVDMGAPGVTVRPLRQLTGEPEFNEVFLDDVFVPDTDVVGDVNDGWRVARTSLENERVSLGRGSWATPRNRTAAEKLLHAAAENDEAVSCEVGDLVATDMALTALARGARWLRWRESRAEVTERSRSSCEPSTPSTSPTSHYRLWVRKACSPTGPLRRW